MNMESQKIKEDRRRKFLNKMENKKNKEKEKKNKEDNKPKQQNQNNMISQNQNNTSPSINNNFQNNIINQIKNNNLINNIINNQNLKEIDFKKIIEESDKYDYMINFQNMIKRILIIILSIIHCINNSPLNNIFVFKCTFIVLELSSVFFNKYYYSKKVELRKKLMNSNHNEGQKNHIEIIIQTLLNHFGNFSLFFVFFKAMKDFFYDICVLVIINIIYFIIISGNK